MAKQSVYQINHPIELQGEEKRYPSINTPLLTYYAVPKIVLPACDRDERWQVISDCSAAELFDS